MADDDGQDNLEEGVQGVEEIQSTDSTNPAWGELLGIIPEELHSQVTPHLSKWDQNYQTGISKVHSQYEPYKFLLDDQIQPDQVTYAMSVLQAIESNPKEVLKALQTYIGEDEQPCRNDQTGSEPSTEPEWLNHPEFKRMNEMVSTMAQVLVQQREQEQHSIQDAEIEEELKSLRSKHGDFDEEWVLTKMMNDDKLELEDAVKAYHSFETGIIEKVRKPGPKVLGPGGSIPNKEIDVKTLDSKGTKSLVEQMLHNALDQNR